MVYCVTFYGELKACESEKIVEWRWFNLKNLPSNVFFIAEKL